MVTTSREERWSALDPDFREYVDIDLGEYLPNDPLVFHTTDPDALQHGRLERAVDAGALIWLTDAVLEDAESLSLTILESVVDRIEALQVMSDAPVIDIDVLKRAHALRELDLATARIDEARDLGGLSALRSFSGSARDERKLFPTGTELDSLALVAPYPATDVSIRSDVQDLLLVNLPRDRQLRFAHPTHLRSLFVKGARVFDLHLLRECVNLRSLTIFGCKDLRGLSRIRELPELQHLSIQATDSLEPWAELLDSAATDVAVLPSQGLDSVTHEKMRSRGWEASPPRDF